MALDLTPGFQKHFGVVFKYCKEHVTTIRGMVYASINYILLDKTIKPHPACFYLMRL